MSVSLKERLRNSTLIFDGAVGTEIYRKNFFLNTSYEELCLSNPRIVKEIHQAYKDAGCDVLTTNSYGANFLQLNKFLLGDKVRSINEAAVKLAREVAGTDLLVAASVGPVEYLPGRSDPEQRTLESVLAEQVEALVHAEPDFLLFESMRGEEDLCRVLNVMKSFPDFPYMVSFAVDRDCCCRTGETPARLLTLLHEAAHQPEAVGLNCGQGPEGMLNALEILAGQCSYPVVVQPNAGMPKSVDNRIIYMCSPEYFSTYAVRFIQLGASGVGGCCGTGPDHIRDMARSIRPLSRAMQSAEKLFVKEESAVLQEVTPLKERSLLGEKLHSGKWIRNVEVVPPQGYVLDSTIEKAKQCKEAGFDAVNLPDGPRASARIASLITAIRIQEEAQIETVLHVCGRDRNLIGIQSELLGCAAMKIRNLLFITGDPPKLGDYPFASGVFDMDSIGMTRLQKRLNQALDLAGKSIGQRCEAVIGVGADPNAVDMEREIRRTREKLEAGADFVVTQPVFDVEPLLRFIDAVPGLDSVPVIAGIWPLASYRNAEFMRNEVPGVIVPDSVMARMAKGATREEQCAEGIRIAREAIERIRTKVAGVQVSAPFGNVKIASAVIAE